MRLVLPDSSDGVALIIRNYFLDRGQNFQLTPKAMAAVEINLSIANLDFNDFINSAGTHGIVRGP